MSNILFVFEGEKTENQITASFINHFFNDKLVITCAFCAEIYQLHRALAEDEDLDTFALLKEIPQNKEILKELLVMILLKYIYSLITMDIQH